MVLDTNILIAFLNGEERVAQTISTWQQEGRALFVSSVSVAEVLSLPRLTPAETRVIRTFLDYLLEVPFDHVIAHTTASLRRKYRMAIPDAAIAATAFLRNVPLVTRDQQFRKVAEIETLSL